MLCVKANNARINFHRTYHVQVGEGTIILDSNLACLYNADILVCFSLKRESARRPTTMAQTPNQPGKPNTPPDVDRDEPSQIYISVDSRKRKRKRGSSRSSRRLEDVENRASKALHRVTKAVNRGVKTYRDKRDRSERKRRDGAIVDWYENASVGIAEAVANSSPVLTDFAKALNTRRRRKQLRRFLRSLPVMR
jgi:hypothetical protein